MMLHYDELAELCALAVLASKEAGALIASYANCDFTAQQKMGGVSVASQVVTEVDFLSQEIILKSLIPSCAKYDLALLSEESEDDAGRLVKDYFWCIDPLDGTLPFIERSTGYAVSIALVSKAGVPQIGVVYDPIEKTVYEAVKGMGALRNGKPWQYQPEVSNSNVPLVFITDRSFVGHRLFSYVHEELKKTAKSLGFNGLQIIQHGGAVMNACWVLENQPACYFKFPKANKGGGSLWDYAATACIFNELKAHVSDIYGYPLDLNRPDSDFLIHRGVFYASSI